MGRMCRPARLIGRYYPPRPGLGGPAGAPRWALAALLLAAFVVIGLVAASGGRTPAAARREVTYVIRGAWCGRHVAPSARAAPLAGGRRAGYLARGTAGGLRAAAP